MNRLAWRAYDAFGKVVFPEKEINDLRRRCGMPTRNGAAVSAYLDAEETVLLTSPRYAEPADDWPPVTMGGFSIWDGPADIEIPPKLDAYLDESILGDDIATAARLLSTSIAGEDGVGALVAEVERVLPHTN